MVVAVAAMSAFGGFASDTTTASADTTVNITIGSAPPAFTPKNITIDVGTTVHWTATGALPHTVTSDGCGDSAAGACTFDSGDTIAKALQGTGANTTFDFKFNNPGVYAFYCRVHGAPGGVGHSGTITVAAASGVTGAPPVSAIILRPSASVVVYSPKEGETIVGDKVNVNLAINGAQLRAPVFGQTNRNFGHFNLVLDSTPDYNAQIGGASSTRSNANTATIENVKPGPHTLIAIWTYDNNVSPQPPINYTVKFTTVAAPAAAAPLGAGVPPSFVPPSTGDGGLLGSSSGGSSSMALYAISAALLAAAGAVGVLGRQRS